MKKFDEIKIGDYFELEKKITSDDIIAFSKASGDYNPIHLDDTYAEKSIFHKRIAHGMLTASIFSNIFGNNFPGEGTIYLKQSLSFCKPVYVDEVIKARVVVKEINFQKKRILFETICYNKCNEKVITGEALVIPPYK